MEPQIYLYKITFEEIPDWYWGIHKENTAGEYYMGSPYTHAWKWEFYTPKKQILQYFEYSPEGYREGKLVEDRLIRPDLNNPLCLNENVGGQYSLEAAALGAYAVHREKDENGKSKHAVRAGRNRAAITNSVKDADGKCVAGKKLAAKTHAQRDENGKSIVAMKLHAEKDENGKSKHAVRNGHKSLGERNEDGKSIQSLKMNSILHSVKDEKGRSVHAMKNVKNIIEQKWEDPDHPELGVRNAGPLARMQKARGLPHGPENRRRVYPADQ